MNEAQPQTVGHTVHSGSPLEVLLASSVQGAPAPESPTSQVGECINTEHPSLLGRVLVRCTQAGGESVERWLPTLQGMTVRLGDRVLLQQPANWPEPLVVGVIDGFATRPDPALMPGPSISIRNDELLQVLSSDGQRLLEIRRGESGWVVRLLQEDTTIDLPGRLCLSAKSLELQAKQGSLSLSASGDVVVQGEVVRLN